MYNYSMTFSHKKAKIKNSKLYEVHIMSDKLSSRLLTADR